MSSYGDFLDFLRYRESTYNPTVVKKGGGYMGHYQLGESALVEIGYIKNDGNINNNNYSSYEWQPRSGVTTVKEFLTNPEIQQTAVVAYHKAQWRQLQAKGADKYIGQTMGDILITKSTLLAASHLKGTGAVSSWLRGGGKGNLFDENKVGILEYMNAVASFDVGDLDPNDSGKFNLYFKVPEKTKDVVGMSKIGSYALADKSSYTLAELQVEADKVPARTGQKNNQPKHSIEDLRSGKKNAKTNEKKEPAANTKKGEKAQTNKESIEALRKEAKSKSDQKNAAQKAKGKTAELDNNDANWDQLGDVIAQSFNHLNQLNKMASNPALPSFNSVLTKPNTLDLLFKAQAIQKGMVSLNSFSSLEGGQMDKNLLKQLWPLADQA